MALALVTRTARALSADLNRYYRILKGIDTDNLILKGDTVSQEVLKITNDGGGATLLLTDTSGDGVLVAGEEGVVSHKMMQSTRFRTLGGTALVAADIALSSGWGDTRSVDNIVGTDGAFRFRVVAGAATFGANPTITVTFKDGTWTTSPIVLCQQTSGSVSVGFLEQTAVSATAVTFTTAFTPLALQTFWFSVLVMGR